MAIDVTPGRFRRPQSAAMAAGAVRTSDPAHPPLRRPGRSARRAAARQELAAVIARAKALIIGSPVIYIDTVAILLPSNVPHRARAELAKHCGQPPQVRKCRACGSGYPYRMTMNQPHAEALKLIEEHFDHIVSEFHVALDLPTRSAPDAAVLTSVIHHLEFQPWHGTRKSRLVEETTSYSGKRRTARNLVIYGDRQSKVTNGSCCHIEFRYKGADTCKARGVRTCDDLLGYNFRKYLDRDMKLGVIDWRRLYQILRRQYPTKRSTIRRALIEKTFEALATPGHRPSFSEHPRSTTTQRALEVVPPECRAALVSTSLNDLLYARTRSDYDAPFSISPPKPL